MESRPRPPGCPLGASRPTVRCPGHPVGRKGPGFSLSSSLGSAGIPRGEGAYVRGPRRAPAKLCPPPPALQHSRHTPCHVFVCPLPVSPGAHLIPRRAKALFCSLQSPQHSGSPTNTRRMNGRTSSLLSARGLCWVTGTQVTEGPTECGTATRQHSFRP